MSPPKHPSRAKEATKSSLWVNKGPTLSTNLRATTAHGCQAAIASSQITTAVLNPFTKTVRSSDKLSRLATQISSLFGLTKALSTTSDALEEICLLSKALEWCIVRWVWITSAVINIMAIAITVRLRTTNASNRKKLRREPNFWCLLPVPTTIIPTLHQNRHAITANWAALPHIDASQATYSARNISHLRMPWLPTHL